MGKQSAFAVLILNGGTLERDGCVEDVSDVVNTEDQALAVAREKVEEHKDDEDIAEIAVVQIITTFRRTLAEVPVGGARQDLGEG